MSFIKPTIVPFTAAASGSLSITGLDLNTDLMYEIEFKTAKASADASLSIRLNNDSGADYTYAAVGLDSGNNQFNGATTGATSLQVINAGLGAQSYKGWSGRIRLLLQSDGRPVVQWHITGTNQSGTAHNMINAIGSGMKDWTTNVTSLQILLSTGTVDWTAKLIPVKFF